MLADIPDFRITFVCMLFLTPEYWQDYELIDIGDFEKLERFGKYITIRPEPQAVWAPALSAKEWEKAAHIRFIPDSNNRGKWVRLKKMPDQWQIQYKSPGLNLQFRLGLTAFKHVGIFPEQAVNWEYINDSLKKMKTPVPKMLNLFAYTGGASLAGKYAGADVVHVDAIKQVIHWARENMEYSGLENIRWTVEDALKFVKREVRRGRRYNGIILDPPAWGNGPRNEKWKLEEKVQEMMEHVVQLLDPEEHFLILNTYSLGFSPLIVENIIKSIYPQAELETGELYLQATGGHKLPLGVFGRCRTLLK